VETACHGRPCVELRAGARMSSDQLVALGRVLLDLAEKRRLHGDV
jgi:hypothetical protein